MLIARIENDAVAEYPLTLFDLQARFPSTLFPVPLTADALPEGYAEVVRAEPPDAGAGHNVIEAAPALDSDVWAQAWHVELMPLADIQGQLREANSARHTVAEAAGVAYVFPDGAGTAQTRDARDLLNISGIAGMADALIDQGETAAVMPFRDAEDATHMMTPEQARLFTQAVGVRITALYQVKWQIRQQIDALPDAETAAAFDVDAAWDAALQQL